MHIFKKIAKRIFKNPEKTTISTPLDEKAVNHVSDLNFRGKETNLAALSRDTYKGLTFLVVDDNIDQLTIMGSFLKNYGAEVDFAKNGKLALQAFFNEPNKYQMIIMDIQMPLMNGDGAAREIRTSKLPKAQSIPLIGISGNLLPCDKKGCDFTVFLQKPFRMGQLAYMIQYIQEIL